MSLARISFSVGLPLAALAVWAVLIPAPAMWTYGQFNRAAKQSSQVHLQVGQFDVLIPRSRFLSFAFESVARRNSHIVISANLPGMIGECAVFLWFAWPSVWHPKNMIWDEWRSIILPFFCLPAWWLAGRGLDGQIGQTQIPRSLAICGFTLFALFLVILAGFLTVSAPERADMAWLLPDLGFWTIAFGTVPYAWARRRRQLRRASVNRRESADARRIESENR